MKLKTCLSTALAVLALACGAPSAAPDELERKAAQAVELYDTGDYDAARPLLEDIVAAGGADGAMLYRLYFCLRETGVGDARQTLLDARAALEAELPESKGLDTPFYLANVYRNTARLSDARRVAEQATTRVEQGKLDEPGDGMGLFQLGKLYADQERDDKAAEWYRKAIRAFAEDGKTLPPSAQWAARFLGQQALAAEDWAGVEDNLGALFAAKSATREDLNGLAIARVRRQDYGGAAEAWRHAGILNPIEGDHPRYCARLAGQAGELGSLPAMAPDGREWETLTPADLETVMGEQAAAARNRLSEAPPREEIENERAKEINAELSGHRAVFVRAALEYAMRGLPIRETAFRGGYAPMIFHGRQWALPPKPRKKFVMPGSGDGP